GTSLSVAGSRLLREIWERDLDWVELGGLPGSARLLEVFLDRLAGVTAATAGHLFDPRYEVTLTEAEVSLRDQLRGLSDFVRDGPTEDRQGVAWEEVRGLLARLGEREDVCVVRPRNATPAEPGTTKQSPPAG